MTDGLPDGLPVGFGKDADIMSQYFSEQLKEVSQKMPPYKVIKYFVLSREDLIKTTTLKVRRPLEQEKIVARLTELSTTMKGASGTFID